MKLDRPLIFFDLESTGVNPRSDRIIEIAAIKLLPDGTRESLSLRINPERPIPAGARAIHGISNDDLKDAPPFRDVAERVLNFFEDCDLGGFGIVQFDIPLLCEELERVGMNLSLKGVRTIDTKQIFHMREPRTLTAALDFYCGQEHETAHSALGDAQAALDVLEGQLQRYPDLPEDVTELSELCNPTDPDAVDRDGKLRWQGDEIVLNFGQKAGMTLRKLASDEPGYLEWIMRKDFSSEVKSIVKEAIQGTFAKRTG